MIRSMDERMRKFTLFWAAGRAALGGFICFAPGVALKLYGAPPEANTPVARYLGRLFGIRNAQLGYLVWWARNDPKRLQHVATLNATVEGLDAMAGATLLLKREGLTRAALSAMSTSLSVGTNFLIMRSAAAKAARRPRWSRALSGR